MSVLGSVKVTGEWIHVLQKMAKYHKNGQLVTIGEHYLVVFGGHLQPMLPITDIEILNGSSSETLAAGWVKRTVRLQHPEDGDHRASAIVCVRNRYDMYLIGGLYRNGQERRSILRCRFTPQSLISMTTTPHNSSSSSSSSSKSSKTRKSKSNAHTLESGLVWERCTPLPVGLTSKTAVSVRAGIIVIGEVEGGEGGDNDDNEEDDDTPAPPNVTSLYLYRTDTKRWSQLGAPFTMNAFYHGSTVIIDPSSGDEWLVVTSGSSNVAWTMNITSTIASTSTFSSISSSSPATSSVSASACQWIRLPSQKACYSMRLVPFETI
jgi:hypothetical protein